MLNYAAVVQLKDRVSGPAKRVASSVRNMSGQISLAKRRISSIQAIQNGAAASYGRLALAARVASRASALTGISVGGLGLNATRITAKYEDLSAVLNTLEGSSAKAQKSLLWVKKFTRETPFGLQATATAFARLRAYGMDPTDGTLRIMGDTAAAMGKDVMAAVEMLADAVVGENERLKEFGIRGAVIKGKKGAKDQIEYTFKDKAGEQQTLRVNKTDQDAIRKALNSIFNEKYGGAMEKRSKTFNGILANLSDTAAEIQNQFMDNGLFKRMKDSAQSKLDMLSKLAASGRVAQWGKTFANYASIASDRLGEIKQVVSNIMHKTANLVGGWKNLAAIAGGFASWWIIKDLVFGIVSGFSLGKLAVAGFIGILSKSQQLLPNIYKYFPALGAWLSTQLPAAVARFKTSAGILKEIWNGKEYWGGNRLTQLRNLTAIAFNADPVRKYGQTVGWLKRIWTGASSQILKLLPALRSNSAKVFASIGQWLKKTGAQLTAVFSILAVAALQRLSALMHRLATMAENGSLHRWLTSASSKITPVVAGIASFAKGLWTAAKRVAIFIGHFAKFVGGWENFGKIILAAGIITFLSGFLQGLAALGAIVMALFTPIGMLAAAIVAVSAAGVWMYQNWETLSTKAKVLGGAVVALVASIVAYKLALKAAAIAQVAWTAAIAASTVALKVLRGVGMLAFLASVVTKTKLTTFAQKAWTAVLVAGRIALVAFRVALTFLTGPIGLVIAAVTAAIALWKNWDKVIAYLKNHFPGLYKFFAETLPNGLNKTIGKIKKVLEWLGLVKNESIKLDIAGGLTTAVTTTVKTIQTAQASKVVGQQLLEKAGGWEGVKGKYTGFVETVKAKAQEARAVAEAGTKISTGNPSLEVIKDKGSGFVGTVKSRSQKARAVVETGAKISAGTPSWEGIKGKYTGFVETFKAKAQEAREMAQAETRPSKVQPIKSPASQMQTMLHTMKGQHELTLNLKSAPGVNYSIEDQKTTGNASKFNVGKQAGADR